MTKKFLLDKLNRKIVNNRTKLIQSCDKRDYQEAALCKERDKQFLWFEIQIKNLNEEIKKT